MSQIVDEVLVRDDERANGIVARAPTGISNDVGVTFR